MTEPSRHDIERLLSSEEAPPPPAGLAGRIKRDIPQGLRLERSVLENMARYTVGRHVPAYRQFVLLAALLVVTIALGILGLRALIEQRAEDERQAAMVAALEKATADEKAEADAAAPPSSRDGAPASVGAPPAPGRLRSTEGAGLPSIADRHGESGLTVTVTSTSGAPLAGVRLRLTRLDPPTAERWTGVTAADGTARLDRPHPGIYRLDASMPGFRPGAVLSLRLEAGRPAKVPLALEPEQAPEPRRR